MLIPHRQFCVDVRIILQICTCDLNKFLRLGSSLDRLDDLHRRASPSCAVTSGVGIAANHLGEMGDLVDQWVGRIARHALLRTSHSTSFCHHHAATAAYQEWTATLRSTDQIAGLIRDRINRVFARCHLPAPRCNDAVGHRDRANRTAFKPQNRGRKVFVFKPAPRRCQLRLHGHDLAAQVADQIDVMHQIDRNRSCTGLFAPWGDLKIVIGLVEPTCRLRGAHIANRHQLWIKRRGLLNDRIVTAVMADKNRNTGCLRWRWQSQRPRQRCCQWLFDQAQECPAQYSARRTIDMQIGRRGQNHAVDLLRLKHRGQVRKHRHIVRARTAGLDNSSQDRHPSTWLIAAI